MDVFNNSTNGSVPFELEFWRQPLHLLITYFVAYIMVFVVGLVGNLFVVVAVALNPSMRVITNYFITSLAIADLLVIIFCVPATLMNNVVNEWYFGNFLCKTSVWINGTAVCASVYTLVAVSADRYYAICHTMRYSTLEPMRTLIIIIPIWIFSGILFLPYCFYFNLVHYDHYSITVQLCLQQFPSKDESRLYFMIVNFAIAFIIPLFAIIAFYIYIYGTIVRRPTLAVDKNAQARDQRVKLKVTHMMVTVVITFAASWFPFYCFFAYVIYNEESLDLLFVQILRAILQWLVLANSCINPILYAYFSRKFRRAFREILVLPCRKRYNQLRDYTRTTRHRTTRIRTQIAETVISRVTMMGGTVKRDSLLWMDNTQSMTEYTENNQTMSEQLSDDGYIANKKQLNNNKGKLMKITKKIDDLEKQPKDHRRESKAVVKNSEVISESSSESEVIEPGMIALSLMTLPCLMATRKLAEPSPQTASTPTSPMTNVTTPATTTTNVTTPTTTNASNHSSENGVLSTGNKLLNDSNQTDINLNMPATIV